MRTKLRLMTPVLVAGLLLVTTVTTLAAATSRAYQVVDKKLLPAGTVVALTDEKAHVVQPATLEQRDRVVGVVSKLNANVIALTEKTATQNVTTAGTVEAFVSTLNGEIRAGDFVSASPLEGVLMRAGTRYTQVVGVAEADFTETSGNEQSLKTTTDGTIMTRVGKIPVTVEIRNLGEEQGRANFLILFGESLTGRTISELQVIVALIIFFLILVIQGSLLYGAIYSSITALGRNPLSRRAIYSELFRVFGVSLLVLAVGLIAIYVVLWV